METINKCESAKFEGVSENDDNTTMMMCSGAVSGKDAYITYLFDPIGKLHQCFYGINDTYNTTALYITAYNTLKENLIEKYGKPSSDEVKNSPALHGALMKTLHYSWAIQYIVLFGKSKPHLHMPTPNHEEVKNTSGL